MARLPSPSALAAVVALFALGAPPALGGSPSPDGLPVARVTASSTRASAPAGAHAPSRLTDGDLRTAWQPAGRTPRFSWVRLELAAPARVDGLVIAHAPADPPAPGHTAPLSTPGRVRTAWILFDDGESEVIRLDPARLGPRRVILARIHETRAVTLVVRDFELGERWNHLALAELTVTGRTEPAAAPAPPAGPATCGTPAWAALRDAVVTYCGDPNTAAHCEDPLLDVVLGCRADPGRALPVLDWPAGAARGAAHWAYTGRWFSVQVDLAPADGAGWRVVGLGMSELPAAADP